MSSSNTTVSEWVTLYTQDLLSWAYHKTSDMHAAEDLVQDTFLVAVEKYSSFRNESQPKTWLLGILNNKLADFYRVKTKGARLSLEGDSTPEQFFDGDERWLEQHRPKEWDQDEHLLDNNAFNEVLRSCLTALPLHWLACVQMKFFSEKNSQEICQELEISMTNYWQVQHRAKLQLRQCLEKHWFKKS